MPVKKPSIPDLSSVSDPLPFQRAVKEMLEIYAGRRGRRIAPLPANASLADVADKLNEIIDLLQ